MKTCNKCHVEKPAADFARVGTGYHTGATEPRKTCKRCRERRSAVEKARRLASPNRRLGEREAQAEARRERAVLARRAGEDEARIAEGWAALAANRAAIS